MIPVDSHHRVMVTGGESMIGRAVRRVLLDRSISIDIVPHSECDLLDEQQVRLRFSQFRPHYVIHAAGYNGGIEFNKMYPKDIFDKTIRMGLNVLDMSCRFKVEKVVSIISSCAYPDLKVEELEEEDFWNGMPNSSVECHGFAKRFLEAYSRQINRQHNTHFISVVLNNSYGPYDSFDPLKTKVVGAMIKRFVDAKKQNLPYVECWGTGAPLREFVYAGDAGKLIVRALERYDCETMPLNLSTGQEISIKELAETTARVVGYEGEIRWNNKADGQMRKRLSTKRMVGYLYPDDSFVSTPLEEGLALTLDWYRKEME